MTTVIMVGKLSVRTIQLIGFGMMTALFSCLAALYEKMRDHLTLAFILYSLTFYFSNFGPNSTTFILPSKTFPTHVRTQLNGVSAAMGKVGAVIGSALFEPLLDTAGVPMVLALSCVVSLMGFLVTLYFVKPTPANYES